MKNLASVGLAICLVTLLRWGDVSAEPTKPAVNSADAGAIDAAALATELASAVDLLAVRVAAFISAADGVDEVAIVNTLTDKLDSATHWRDMRNKPIRDIADRLVNLAGELVVVLGGGETARTKAIDAARSAADHVAALAAAARKVGDSVGDNALIGAADAADLAVAAALTAADRAVDSPSDINKAIARAVAFGKAITAADRAYGAARTAADPTADRAPAAADVFSNVEKAAESRTTTRFDAFGAFEFTIKAILAVIDAVRSGDATAIRIGADRAVANSAETAHISSAALHSFERVRTSAFSINTATSPLAAAAARSVLLDASAAVHLTADIAAIATEAAVSADDLARSVVYNPR